MEVTLFSLIVKSAYVIIMGAASITANTLIKYHHYQPSKNTKTSGGVKRNENKSASERLDKYRSLSESD